MTRIKPEAAAREEIDRALTAAGWVVQHADEVNLYEAAGVAVREFKMADGHGTADYLLFVDQKAVCALEAKKVGHTLTGVEGQANKYGDGLPDHVQAPIRPLPFLLLSTGVQTKLTNRLDPHPRAREIFAPPKPETLREWLAAEPLRTWMTGWKAPPERLLSVSDSSIPKAFNTEPPSSLRSRLRAMPPSDAIPGLWPNQIKAITGIEKSLADDRPRALVQMATGSGKSLTSVAQIYRLIKFGGARRILFLVDRDNLATQAYDEFVGYRTYDDNRKFTELYTPQRLTSNTIGGSSKVVITTIQRLYSMLKGEAELDPELEQGSVFDSAPLPQTQPAQVEYNPALPPEYFDFIFIDECHRSIYTLWGQVLDYFDAYLIGLTATPAKHTFGFFKKNLVMEYTQEMAVADGVNVDFDIYRIRTKVTEQGASVAAADTPVVGRRNRMTRQMRWERPDEDISYTAGQLGPRRGRDRSDSVDHQNVQGALVHGDFPGAHSGAEDVGVRQRRQPRRRHRRHHSGGVRQGQRLLPKDHVQGERHEAEATDPRLPYGCRVSHRGHGRHGGNGHGRTPDRDRHVPPLREEQRAVRANEGTRRARRQIR
jgi:type I restriction enzyme R subunit